MTMPWPIEPMTAASGDLPAAGERWGLELKWDGLRVLASVSADGVRASGGGTADLAARYPELSGLADLLPHHDVILDGMVVAFADGRPSFARLRRRLEAAVPDARLVREVPVRYVVFDLLFLDGRPLFEQPYAGRRALLDELDLAATGPVEVPPYLDAADTAQVAELLEFTREQRVEGLLAKRLDSPYLPGARSDHWRKITSLHARRVVVCGWKPGRGRREGGVGALLLGEYDGKGRLCVSGCVETGFTDAVLDGLHGRLAPLARAGSPFDEQVPPEDGRGARWVEPRLVGEVAYSVREADGRLRYPAWRGLRDGEDPLEVVREE
ncbi:ATP-dependent DNA ligase [Actinomadura parmotrematis]|uniref:DNA ligase (ATP) n=1 Tax=Actinomadura parmotrematis TaxID=2864039 RepID=A0ABS7FLR1_9ACTN|nr:DNA polymerase LigD [Actinomadura parmotrematis]MBW8481301.1 DNA polymerase LigD [Actinomadura parmotrematis]